MLYHKLEYYGIRGLLQEWFKSFLTHRSQVMVRDGASSAPITLASGVPQGTVLRPILFLLYVNDLADGLKSTVRLFVDDALLHLLLFITRKYTVINANVKLINSKIHSLYSIDIH